MNIGEEKKGETERSGGSERLPNRPKAVGIKGVVICSKYQCECELEIPAPGAIIDHELVKNDHKIMNDALKPPAKGFGPHNPREKRMTH